MIQKKSLWLKWYISPCTWIKSLMICFVTISSWIFLLYFNHLLKNNNWSLRGLFCSLAHKMLVCQSTYFIVFLILCWYDFDFLTWHLARLLRMSSLSWASFLLGSHFSSDSSISINYMCKMRKVYQVGKPVRGQWFSNLAAY